MNAKRLSPELQHITLWADEQADLEIDMLLYGNAYIRTSGERVDPRALS